MPDTEYPKPKSICACGHLGDGPYSDHRDLIQPGHGGCKIPGCSCVRFSWKRFTKAYEEERSVGN